MAYAITVCRSFVIFYIDFLNFPRINFDICSLCLFVNCRREVLAKFSFSSQFSISLSLILLVSLLICKSLSWSPFSWIHSLMQQFTSSLKVFFISLSGSWRFCNKSKYWNVIKVEKFFDLLYKIYFHKNIIVLLQTEMDSILELSCCMKRQKKSKSMVNGLYFRIADYDRSNINMMAGRAQFF